MPLQLEPGRRHALINFPDELVPPPVHREPQPQMLLSSLGCQAGARAPYFPRLIPID